MSAADPQHGPTGIPWRSWKNGLFYHDALPCPKCARRSRPAGCATTGCDGLDGFRGAGLPGCPPYSDSDEPARYPLKDARP